MVTRKAQQQRYRARRRQAGQQRIELWLDAENLAQLGAIRQRGERLDALLIRALDALHGVTGDSVSGDMPTKVRNAVWFVTCPDLHGETDVFGLFELRRIHAEQIS